MKSQKGTWKLVSPPQAKKNFGKILPLRQVFSNLVSLPQAKNISWKIPSLSWVFSFPDEKKKTVTETSFDWNLIFLRKTKKKKQYIYIFPSYPASRSLSPTATATATNNRDPSKYIIVGLVDKVNFFHWRMQSLFDYKFLDLFSTLLWPKSNYILQWKKTLS